ncbi:Fc.00g013410.m01.CDS01 [Cosmosporella sp. VM-42]
MASTNVEDKVAELRKQQALESAVTFLNPTARIEDPETFTSLNRGSIVLLGQNVAPGYHRDTLIRAGRSSAPALRTEVKTLVGRNTPQAIIITFSIRRGKETTDIATVTLNISVDHPVEHNTYGRGDVTTIHNIINNVQLTTQDWGWTEPQDEYEKNVADRLNAGTDDLVPAHYIAATENGVIMTEAKVPQQAATVTWNHKYFASERLHTAETQTLAKQLRESIQEAMAGKDGLVSFGNLFPSYDGWEAHWSPLEHGNVLEHPYASFAAYARQGQLNDVDYRNVNIAEADRPEKPTPAVAAFLSNDHRTAALISSAADEVYYELWKATVCEVSVFQTFAYPVAGTEWTGSAEAFGIEPTGQPLSYILGLEMGARRSQMPDVGTKVKMELKITYATHAAPSKELSPRDIVNISQEVQSAIALVNAKADNAATNKQAELAKRMDEDDEPDEEDDIPTYRTKHYNAGLKRELARYLPSDSLAVTGAELDLKEGETPADQIIRIQDYVQKEGLPENPAPDGGAILWPAVRLEQPPGVTADYAFFLAQVPRQQNWPPIYEKPPLIPRTELPKLQKDSNITMGDWFQKITEGNMLESSFVWNENAMTALHECRAVWALNNVKTDSLIDRWWRYTLAFQEQDKPDDVDLLARFPGLLKRHALGKYVGGTEQVIGALQKAPAGKMFITGCPGSGKSSFGVEICDAVMATAPTTGQAWTPETPDALTKNMPDDATLGEDQVDAEIKDTLDNAARVTMPVRTTEQITPAKEETMSIPIRTGVWDKKVPSTRVQAPAEAQVKRTQGGVIVWTAPQNRQVADAVNRLQARCPDKIITRMYPWEREMRALLSATSGPPGEIVATGAAGCDEKLVRFTNKCLQQNYIDCNPYTDEHSCSARALNMMKGTAWETLIKASRSDMQNDYTSWNKNATAYKAAARELLVYVLTKSDAICATPVALSQMADHMPTVWFPSLSIVDEAARLPEASALVVASRWPLTPTIFLGDPRQFGPLSLAGSDRYFNAVYSDQRQTSILDRAARMGAVNAKLTKNYRAHGTVANFVREICYRTEMSIHKRKTKQASAYHNWLREHCQTAENMVFVDVGASQEEQRGTSWINPVNARYTVQLARYIAKTAPVPKLNGEGKGTILIITPYLQQKYELDRLLADITDLNGVTIDVRTVDDAPSFEAEVVLYDWVRTMKPGFIEEFERVAVAMSRAMLGCFVIGSTRCHTISYLRNFMTWTSDRQGVIKTRSWDRWCTKCESPGHYEGTCRKKSDTEPKLYNPLQEAAPKDTEDDKKQARQDRQDDRAKLSKQFRPAKTQLQGKRTKNKGKRGQFQQEGLEEMRQKARLFVGQPDPANAPVTDDPEGEPANPTVKDQEWGVPVDNQLWGTPVDDQPWDTPVDPLASTDDQAASNDDQAALDDQLAALDDQQAAEDVAQVAWDEAQW